mgnify:CR=1 FL=1
MSLNIENLRVSLQKKKILHGIDLEIQEGEFVSLLGKSGCGKTTLLKCIAGLLEQESGDIRIQGASVMDQQPKERGTVIVFQDLRLFPHMTAEKNIAFPMELRKVPKKEQKERVEALLRAVQLPGFEKRRMKEMSGGQMQRVALARAIVIHPQVLLMDEPLSNLEAKLRIEMRSAIRDVQKQVGITTVYVTHDQEEALAISDRIAVMKLGIIQQIGSPQDIYARPYNAFVSTFIGHSNLFFGTIRKQGSVPSVVFEVGYHVEMANLVDTVTEGQKVVVSVRPEEFSLNPEGMECEIISRTFLGKYTNYFLRFGDGMVLEDQPSIEYSQDLGHVDRIFSVGEKIRLRPNPNKINVFTQDMEQSLIKDVKRYDE